MKNMRPILLVSSVIIVVCALSVFFAFRASASPFGQGVFGANVPFGSLTSLSINLGSNVALSLAPDGPNLRGSGSHVVTVTSNDVVGYQLFVRSLNNTDMTNGSATIPASANSSPAALSINTWGYNTDASANYTGMLTTPRLIKDTSGPSTGGDATTVTYGAYTDTVQESGTYTTSVVYMVIAENQ